MPQFFSLSWLIKPTNQSTNLVVQRLAARASELGGRGGDSAYQKAFQVVLPVLIIYEHKKTVFSVLLIVV